MLELALVASAAFMAGTWFGRFGIPWMVDRGLWPIPSAIRREH